MSGNFSFSMNGEGSVLSALQYIADQGSFSAVRWFDEDFYNEVPRLLFFWPVHMEGVNKLVTETKITDLEKIIQNWLDKVEYPVEPDIDGDSHKGWIISNGNFWGHTEGHPKGDYCCLTVQPCWMMYGK